MAIQFHKMHAGGRSYTCDTCHLRYWASAKELANNEITVCEGCFQDGVLDDININGDMASVNTSGVY